METSEKKLWPLVAAAAVAVAALFLSTHVEAGEKGGGYSPKHNAGQGFNARVSSSSSSIAKASSYAISGAVISAPLSASAEQNPVQSIGGDKTNAYALGMAVPPPSQGECPLLASTSFAIFATNWEVERCAMQRDVELMTSVRMDDKPMFSAQSVLNRICQFKPIADVASECTNRTMQQQ